MGHPPRARTHSRPSTVRRVGSEQENLAAEIDGPRWQIAPENPVRLEAAKEAAAAGRRTGRVLAAEPMPVEPGEHAVAASVRATFALET